MRGIFMVRNFLSTNQLRQIEQEVDKIIARANLLNPNNPDDAEILFYDDLKIDEYLHLLETSHKNIIICSNL